MANSAKLQLAGRLSPRERIWTEIRRQDASARRFTVMCLEDHTRCEIDTIAEYLDQLRRGGYIAAVEGTAGRARDRGGKVRAVVYLLVRDCGVEAPRLDKQGRPVTRGNTHLNLWRSMKALKVFDFRELRASAQTDDVRVSEQTAKSYCLYLARAGYLRVVKAAPRHAPTRYYLTRDTGPRAPQISKVKHVYDPNLGEVVWHPEAAA